MVSDKCRELYPHLTVAKLLGVRAESVQKPPHGLAWRPARAFDRIDDSIAAPVETAVGTHEGAKNVDRLAREAAPKAAGAAATAVAAPAAASAGWSWWEKGLTFVVGAAGGWISGTIKVRGQQRESIDALVQKIIELSMTYPHLRA